jgi:N-acetyl-anhydromuramyl-L-alanine amidase AmpD
VSRGLFCLLVVCALVGAHAAAARDIVKRPALTWIRGDGSYAKASRTPQAHTIDTIVIHATDGGSMLGNVWWLSGGHSHASAHYVVARDGSIVQLVHLSDIAWHAGNSKVNRHSIGIEHVGETYDPAGFTDAEYRSSARLVAWLVRHYDIPVDRAHIIGHAQVPDPKHPGEYGGRGHHTDPGPYWRWDFYLSLVRRYAFPERYAIHVDTTTFGRGQTLTGVVPWSVRTKGPAAERVDFSIDGRVVWSDQRKPFAFAGGRGWNTTRVDNGVHVLTVRATGADGAATQRLLVRVANRDFALTTSALHAWQKVKGTLRIRASVRGARTGGIGLYVDGHVVSRDHSAPYAMRWNSHRVHNGRHWVTLAAVAADGRIAKRRLPLVVANHPRPKKKPAPHPKPRPHPKPKPHPNPQPKPQPKPQPRPKPQPHPKPRPQPKPNPRPLPPPQVTAQNLADGQAVSGIVDWRAHTIGPVARVEFAVDGTVIATSTTEPWATTWDSSAALPGVHTLELRAYTNDGRRAVLTISVTSTS